jgi:two-component system, OmpR family, phosphate regulon response regulator PhoB
MSSHGDTSQASFGRQSSIGIAIVAEESNSCAGARRIAVVEDDQALALLLKYNLEAVGYEVEMMTDGAEADARIPHEEFDLVVLDWGLPQLAGIEVLRRMRIRANHTYLTVIMLTARGDRESRLRAVVNGVDVFLAKPFSVGELLSQVSRLLAHQEPAPG